jgi:hypothetical protein
VQTSARLAALIVLLNTAAARAKVEDILARLNERLAIYEK